ncbi:MAG: hypothetical protein ACTHWA_07350 [Arachnia sp.]
MQVTATGSLPGDDFRGALGALTEVLPDILPLPELPDRGVGSQMVGRRWASSPASSLICSLPDGG